MFDQGKALVVLNEEVNVKVAFVFLPPKPTPVQFSTTTLLAPPLHCPVSLVLQHQKRKLYLGMLRLTLMLYEEVLVNLLFMEQVCQFLSFCLKTGLLLSICPPQLQGQALLELTEVGVSLHYLSPILLEHSQSNQHIQSIVYSPLYVLLVLLPLRQLLSPLLELSLVQFRNKLFGNFFIGGAFHLYDDLIGSLGQSSKTLLFGSTVLGIAIAINSVAKKMTWRVFVEDTVAALLFLIRSLADWRVWFLFLAVFNLPKLFNILLAYFYRGEEVAEVKVLKARNKPSVLLPLSLEGKWVGVMFRYQKGLSLSGMWVVMGGS